MLTQQNIGPETQKRLNNPLPLEGMLDPKDEAFLQQILQKIDKNEINLFTPSSLINNQVYDKLTPQEQAKVDMEAFSTLAALREITGLWKAGKSTTYQLQNLLHKVRLTKEKFEREEGDVFII